MHSRYVAEVARVTALEKQLDDIKAEKQHEQLVRQKTPLFSIQQTRSFQISLVRSSLHGTACEMKSGQVRSVQAVKSVQVRQVMSQFGSGQVRID